MGGQSYPGGVPYSLNYPEIPLYAFLENSARKFPDRIGAIFYGNKITYARLWDGSRRLAAALVGLGLEKGGRVAFLLPNVPQFIVAYNAVLAASGVVVPVNPLNPSQEIAREIEETRAEILIALDRLLGKLPEEKPRSLIVADAAGYAPTRLRLLSRLKHRGLRLPSGALSFEKLLEGPLLEKTAEVDPREDLAAVLYTSGTTGPPKGVMLTHYNLVVNALQSYHWLRGWGFSAKPQQAGWPVVVCAVPFFHGYGMTVAMNEAVQFGCSLVLVPEPTPVAIMDAIQRHRATHLPAIPRFIQEILAHPDLKRYDLTSLISCLSGGAPIDPRLIERFVEVTGAAFYYGYGLTEAGPCTHCTPTGSAQDYRTTGLPFPDTDVKIVDIQLGEVDLPPMEKGELVIRGPQVMKGYWNDPEGTAEALRGGWLYTGDIAYVNGKGYLYVVGRKRDRIIAEGRTVWPSEIEEALASHPMVEAAVVVGVPDPLRCSTDVRAMVTLREWNNEEIAVRKLLKHCRERLEYFQVPAEITVAASLPMTTSGKVDRLAVEAELERLTLERLERS